MYKKLLSVLLCLSLLTIVKGQAKRIVEDYYKEEINFFSEWWHNPAMRFASPHHQFTDVSFNYSQEDNEAFAVQKGSEISTFKFRANSFFRDANKLYYGKAAYNKWDIEGSKWNSSSDIDLIYPYIVADDARVKVANEQYSLAGGYAQRFGKINLGASASYRAMTAYKRKDPRPKNTIYDLSFRLGGTYQLSNKYLLGSSLYFNKYQQRQSIRVYAKANEPNLYYLRGIGITFDGFDITVKNGSVFGNEYIQNTYAVRLSLLPLDKKGVFATTYFSKKQLNLCESEEPLREIITMNINTATANLGYGNKTLNMEYFVKLYGKYKQAKSKEYTYQVKILSQVLEKYTNMNYVAGLEALATYHLGNTKSLSNFDISYNRNNERYIDAQQRYCASKEINNLKGNIQQSFLWNFKKSSFLTKIGASYRHNLKKKLKTSDLTHSDIRETLVEPDFRFYTTNAIGGKLTLRYDYQLHKEFSIYGKTKYRYANYKNIGNRQYGEVTLGLTF